jgi:CDP-paratose 2-epimerase
MDTVLVTGAAGLVGAECVRYFSALGMPVVGIDNDMRKYFFGEQASTEWSRRQLVDNIPSYTHHDIDIRDKDAMERVFQTHGTDIGLVIHTAAQPSHDWAVKEPMTDFHVNATGTLHTLELARLHCPDTVFIHTSTNKVYGDTPNQLPMVETETRWEVDKSHRFFEHGIDESMTIDACTHSLFGVSKVAADMAVQEYGRYFGMKTAVFRGGCLTGPGHSGAELHGFLSYLMKCAMTGTPYTIYGYKGKQVRDNIHCNDLVRCFDHFRRAPRVAEVYNIGGSRRSNCSMLEAIGMCEEITGKTMSTSYDDTNRIGDHIWWISDVSHFKSHYPEWDFEYGIRDILQAIHDGLAER